MYTFPITREVRGMIVNFSVFLSMSASRHLAPYSPAVSLTPTAISPSLPWKGPLMTPPKHSPYFM